MLTFLCPLMSQTTHWLVYLIWSFLYYPYWKCAKQSQLFHFLLRYTCICIYDDYLSSLGERESTESTRMFRINVHIIILKHKTTEGNTCWNLSVNTPVKYFLWIKFKIFFFLFYWMSLYYCHYVSNRFFGVFYLQRRNLYFGEIDLVEKRPKHLLPSHSRVMLPSHSSYALPSPRYLTPVHLLSTVHPMEIR